MEAILEAFVEINTETTPQLTEALGEILGAAGGATTRRWQVDPDRPTEGLYEREIVAWVNNNRDEKFSVRLGCTIPAFFFLHDLIEEAYPIFPIHNISLKKGLCIWLYKIVSGVAYYIIEDAFKVSISVAITICNTITNCLCSGSIVFENFVKVPLPDEMEDSCRAFYNHNGIIGAIGAIDGTYIPIVTTELAYLNRKGFTSTNNQIVVSAFGKIWSCNTGTPGSVSDLTMYEISNFRLWAEQSLPRFGHRFVMGYKIHYYILGDGIYRPRSVLIAPYDETQATPDERTDHYAYNYGHSSCRIRVEQVIGNLKGKFKVLSSPQKYGRTTEATVEGASKIFEACCCVWNIFLDIGEVALGYTPLERPIPPLITVDENIDRDVHNTRQVVMQHYLDVNYGDMSNEEILAYLNMEMNEEE